MASIFRLNSLLALFGCLLASVSGQLLADEPTIEKRIRRIQVAVVQFESQPGQAKQNYQRIEELTRTAVKRGARWVLFHEVSLADYKSPQKIPEGPLCNRMIVLAKTLKCFISFGTAEQDKEKVYISQFFVGPNGFIYRYRKTWLWQPLGEWRWYDPGTGPEGFQFDGVDATCFICSDGVSDRCIKKAGELKPSIVFYPNSRPGKLPFSQFGSWAKSIGAPILFSNRSGGKYIGGCTIFDQSGEIQVAANRDGREEILYHTLSLPIVKTP